MQLSVFNSASRQQRNAVQPHLINFKAFRYTAPRHQRSLLNARRNTGGYDDPSSFLPNPPSQSTIPGKGEILSENLDSTIRKKVSSAIHKLGHRCTIGDVAATAGVKLSQAEDALRALANDALATLEVSPTGEILYIFDPRFDRSITSRSFRLRTVEPAVAKATGAISYLSRVAFGTALITSIITVYLAITVIASSSSNDRDRNRGGGGGGAYFNPLGPRMWFNFTDILWYWDPWYYRRRALMRASLRPGEDMPPMTFFEAVFSFVFGDGDPNTTYDAQRWEAVGQYIRYRGGAVTAEEIAPFLDIEGDGLTKNRRNTFLVDEGYMLPVVARFGGEPVVDGSGHIVYVFPALQQVGSSNINSNGGKSDRPRIGGGIAGYFSSSSSSSTKAMSIKSVMLEEKWEMTAATSAQQMLSIALGAANAVGVFVLGNMLANPANQYALMRSGMGWVTATMPLLSIYAAAFFAIPAIRWVVNGRRNAAIETRNQARIQALQLLKEPDEELIIKLREAAKLADKKVFQSDEAVFKSNRAASDDPVDLESVEFEKKLERRLAEQQEKEEKEERQRGWQPAPKREDYYTNSSDGTTGRKKIKP